MTHEIAADTAGHLIVVAHSLRAAGFVAMVDSGRVMVTLTNRDPSVAEVTSALAAEELDELTTVEQIDEWVCVRIA